MWSGIGTPVDSTLGNSLMCSNAAQHSVITLYRSPDLGGFALV